MTDTKTHDVIRQDWLETERGWGTRPDGYSLHLSPTDLKAYVAAYWDGMPDTVPDEYSKPCGGSETVAVDEATHAELVAAGGSLRRY